MGIDITAYDCGRPFEFWPDLKGKGVALFQDLNHFQTSTQIQQSLPKVHKEVHLEASAQVQPVPSTSTGSQEFVSKQDIDKLTSQLDEWFVKFEALLNRGNIFTTPKMPDNVVPPPVSDRPFIDPSGVQATGPVLPSTSVEASGSDKHKKKSKSSKKSVLPATGPVDSENKISSDIVVQLVLPGPGNQSSQPT